MSKQNIFQRLGDATEQAILSRVKNASIFSEYYKRGKKGAPWKRQAHVLQKKEIEDMTNAIVTATDPENPRRGDLMRFYQTLNTDLHLVSCIENRILPIQCAKFNLNDKDGAADLEAKKLLDKPWFLELQKLVVKSSFEGTTLIELFNLNERGEVKEVVEIPQSNFIAHKGIILKEEYDDDGVSFKEGFWKDYYVQVGGDWSLGSYMAVGLIVLAKKLGLGSWLSYIDKFGVPPVFATTERMDTGRRDELFEMLENFRMNHFAVLQGKEKIEIPNNYNVDAYNSFLALNKYADTLLSKYFLGGTGTTEENSYVGSAEVHERILMFRNKVDKLLFKFFFNEEIKPRLVKLSSVYAPLENLTFEYDEKETLSLKETLELIKELSQYYEFEIDELVRITGLPISKVKSTIEGTNTDKPDSQKKKINAKSKGLAPYAHTKPNFVLFAATWDAAIDRLANQLYNGEVKTTELDNDLVLKNYAAFNKEAQLAWGKGYYDETITRNFRENFLKFSGAKSYDLMKQLNSLNTKGISKDDYIAKAKSIVQIHNATYLTTELRFCSTSVSAAQDYETYLNDVDIYPNLKCRTMADDDVRDTHAANEGIVKPVKEWKSLPPWDHNCRCWLEQTLESPTTGRNLKGLVFKNNPHNSKEVFTQEQSYFQNIEAKNKGVIRDNTELMKKHMPYNQTILIGDNKVFVNDFSDLIDTEASVDAAKTMAKNMASDIYILPHIDNSNKTAIKNPELGIGKPSELADLKTFGKQSSSTKNFVKNNIHSANKQKCSWVILDLTNAPEENYLAIAARKLRGDLSDKSKMNKGIKHVVIIRGKKSLKVSRKQINSRDFIKHFNLD